MPSQLDFSQWADELRQAVIKRSAIAQLSSRAQLDIPAAYQIQHALMNSYINAGDHLVGAKLGLTSEAKMQQVGVNQPIFGYLVASMQRQSHHVLKRSDFIHPRAEPEIAFRLGYKEVAGLFIEAIAPAIEIIDSRYHNFKFDVCDVIADNCSGAAFIIGEWQPFMGRANNLPMAISLDGQIQESGNSNSILGDPLKAYAMGLDVASQLRFPLGAGSILLAGAATAAITLKVGRLEVTVEGLGSVAIQVTD